MCSSALPVAAMSKYPASRQNCTFDSHTVAAIRLLLNSRNSNGSSTTHATAAVTPAIAKYAGNSRRTRRR